MADLAQLQVQLELQTAAFQQGVKDVDRRLKGMNKNVATSSRAFKGLENQFKSLKSGMSGIAGAFAAAFSVSAIKNVISVNSQMAKTADTLGLTVKSYQELEFAANRAGIASSQFSSNMTAFVKRVGEANAGMGPLVSGLKNLNPALLENIKAAKGQEAALRVVADAIKNAESATEKAAIANAAFSRSGVGMVKMLEDGARGLNDMATEAEKLGIIMDEDLVRAAERFDDQLLELEKRIKTTFGTVVLETLQTVMDEFGLVVVAFSATIEKAYNKTIGFFKMLATANTAAGASDNGAATKIKNDMEAANKLIDEAVTLTFKKALADKAAREEAAKLAAERRRAEAGTGGGPAVPDGLSDAEKALKAYNDQMDKLAESTKRAVDPMYVFQSTMTDLNVLLETGRISWDDYAAAVLLAQGKLEGAVTNTKKVGEDIKSLSEDIKDAINGFASDFTNNLVDGLAEGKLAFKDFAADILKTIAKIVLNKQFESLFSMLAGGLTGGFSGGAAATATRTTRAISIPGSTTRVGTSAVGKMSAPNYGAMSRGGGSSKPNVTVNNYAGSDVGVSTSTDQNGDIEIAIEAAMGKAIGQGAFDSQMKSSYGLRRRAY